MRLETYACIICKVDHDRINILPRPLRSNGFFVRGYPVCYECDDAVANWTEYRALYRRADAFLAEVCDTWTLRGVGSDFL